MIKRFRSIPWRTLIPLTKIPPRPIFLALSTPKPVTRFHFTTTKSIEELEEEWEFLDKIRSHKCDGCGVPLQCDQAEQQGFIPRNKAIQVMKHNLRVKETPYTAYTGGGDQMSLKAQRLLKDHIKGVSVRGNKREDIKLNITDPNLLDALERSNMMTKTELLDKYQNNKVKRLICVRCHKLKHESRIEENVQARVTSVEPDRIFKDIFNQVRKGSTILHIVDLTDFSATISKKAIEAARKKGCKVLLAVNKIDVMPSLLSEARIKFWIRMRISELGVKMMPEDIYLISSKSGMGVKELGQSLKKMAEKLKQSERDLYIIGHTNAGKSSFINSLIKESNRFKKERYRDPFENKQRADVKSAAEDNFEEKGEDKIKLKGGDEASEEINLEEGELEAQEKSESFEEEEFKLNEDNLMGKENEEAEPAEGEEEFVLEPEKEVQELTVSPFHGTTLELVKIEDLHLTFKVWDSPGIPNLQHISTFMDSQKDASKLLHHKRVVPEKFLMRKDTSLWVGALARLDYSSGDEICAVVYCSNAVSLHRTLVQKSNMLYVKQYDQVLTPVFRKDVTKTMFNAYTIEVECGKNGCGMVEVDIFGLGWIGFYAHNMEGAKATFTLYLPQEVGYAVRDALINFDDKSVMPVKKRHILHREKPEIGRSKERHEE